MLIHSPLLHAYDGSWYKTFAQNKLFPCIHPKSKVKKVEFPSKPSLSKGLETARGVIYYKGWSKKHKMEFEIHTTNIGGKPHANVNILHDTNALKRMTCKMVLGWVELPGEGPAAGGSSTAPSYDASWYKAYAQGPAFRCMHPKSKKPNAKVTVAPTSKKGIAKARVIVYYKGWIKKHKMEFEIYTTMIGGKAHARVNVLQDTNVVKNVACGLTSQWMPVQ